MTQRRMTEEQLPRARAQFELGSWIPSRSRGADVGGRRSRTRKSATSRVFRQKLGGHEELDNERRRSPRRSSSRNRNCQRLVRHWQAVGDGDSRPAVRWSNIAGFRHAGFRYGMRRAKFFSGMPFTRTSMTSKRPKRRCARRKAILHASTG